MKGKLALKYIGPFEIIERFGLIVYQLALPSYLTRMHDVFNVLLLQKAKLDLTRILLQVPIEIREDLTMEVQLVRILDRNVKELRNKKVLLVKILWQNSKIEEET